RGRADGGAVCAAAAAVGDLGEPRRSGDRDRGVLRPAAGGFGRAVLARGGARVEGPRGVPAFRQIAGGTDPVEKAAPGSIRADYALETQNNLVHGSDSDQSAAREIALWFPG